MCCPWGSYLHNISLVEIYTHKVLGHLGYHYSKKHTVSERNLTKLIQIELFKCHYSGDHNQHCWKKGRYIYTCHGMHCISMTEANNEWHADSHEVNHVGLQEIKTVSQLQKHKGVSLSRILTLRSKTGNGHRQSIQVRRKTLREIKATTFNITQHISSW